MKGGSSLLKQKHSRGCCRLMKTHTRLRCGFFFSANPLLYKILCGHPVKPASSFMTHLSALPGLIRQLLIESSGYLRHDMVSAYRTCALSGFGLPQSFPSGRQLDVRTDSTPSGGGWLHCRPPCPSALCNACLHAGSSGTLRRVNSRPCYLSGIQAGAFDRPRGLGYYS